MKRTWVIVLAVVVIVAVGYWWMSRRGGDQGIDLVQAFRAAEKRTPLDPSAAFSMEPQTIKGESKPSIYAHPPSRIIFRDVVVPDHARLELSLGIKEDAWPKGTDGVYFRVGVSYDGVYKDLLTRHVDPYRVEGDKGWVPVSLDLSDYAGKTVNVVFNTQESVPGVQPNALYDFAVFGAPRIRTVPAS